MDYEKAVEEFLSRPENFRTALEVAERMEQVKVVKQVAFWGRIRAVLEERLRDSPHRVEWTVVVEDHDSAISGSGIYLVQRMLLKRPKTLCFGLATYEQDEFSLYYSVEWETEVVDPKSNKELRSLRDKLRDAGCRRSEWWLGWRNIRAFESRWSFLIELADKSEEMAVAVVDAYWAFFAEFCAEVKKANDSLMK